LQGIDDVSALARDANTGAGVRPMLEYVFSADAALQRRAYHA
jgi:hypothetical protein